MIKKVKFISKYIIKKIDVHCTYCGEIVQRHKKWAIISCYDCKMKRIQKRELEHRKLIHKG